MKHRLWMTAAALAAPTISLLVGLCTTFAVVHLANTMVGDSRQRALEREKTETAVRVERLPQNPLITVTSSPTLGGNVNQDVSGKRLGLTPEGTLKKRVAGGQTYPWIAVLECVL